MMVKGGNYITAEQYRAKMGWANIETLYRNLRLGNVEGAVKTAAGWLIPADAVCRDRRVVTGKYIGKRARQRARREYQR